MKSKLFAVLLLAGGSLFAGPRISVGIGLGYAPAPVRVYAAPPVVAYAPPVVVPGPVYVAHPRRYWVAPRYFGGRSYRGYWRR